MWLKSPIYADSYLLYFGSVDLLLLMLHGRHGNWKLIEPSDTKDSQTHTHVFFHLRYGREQISTGAVC